jgi:riboflavin kinase
MRDKIAGPDIPTKPFPIMLKGEVTKGFGRGSSDLGIRTANLPDQVANSAAHILETGIYFGFASVGLKGTVYPMVMSYGWNPFYKNEKRSAEVHIIHHFENDFYGEELRIVILGYIRPELNYTTLGTLLNNDRSIN